MPQPHLPFGPPVPGQPLVRALRDHHRNLSDEQLRAIASGGGVVCVNFCAGFIANEGATVPAPGS